MASLHQYDFSEIRNDAALLVASGCKTREEVLQDVTDWANDEYGDVDGELLSKLVDSLFDARIEEEKKWPDNTDFDRLDAAFTALEGRGFVALHNADWSPSGASYVAELEYEKSGGAAAGKYYTVFYHTQSIDSAIEGAGLYLSYEAFDGNPEFPDLGMAWKAAGMMVVEELAAQGLACEWDGNPARNILVAMNWQKRHISVPIPAPHKELLEHDEPPPPSQRP